MIELSPSQYATTRALFAPLTPYHLAIESLLARKSAGTILVDDPERPRTALARVSHRVFLGGDPGSGPGGRTVDLLAGYLAHARLPVEFGLYYTPAWESVLRDHLEIPGKKTFRGLRHYYAGHALHHDWRILLPDGFILRPIDAPLLAETRLKNLFDLVDELKSERESVTTFLWRSFGFVIQTGHELAGWCTSEYNTGLRCEVGIATLESYRRRGIATAMASALIEHALVNGYTEIGWHCWANNAGSVATARKLGLEKQVEYPVWIVYQ